MSGTQAEAELPDIDLGVLETWLENLPNADDRHRQEQLAERAAELLENLSECLGAVSERLLSIQAGLALLELPKFQPGPTWEDLQESLDKLPKIDIRALAAFAEGHGRTLPNQAERLGKAADAHWRNVCERLAREITTPLRTIYEAMAKAPGANTTRVDAAKLIVKRVSSAKETMLSDPGVATDFLAAKKVAQDYLTRALSGAPNPDTLVSQLAAGELRLGKLSESELEALRSSPLSHAITLKI